MANEYITRQAVRDTARAILKDPILIMAVDAVAKAAPGGVEVVRAHWIGGDLDEDGNGQYWCSNCGVGEKHNPTVPVSYCWNCGAKM